LVSGYQFCEIFYFIITHKNRQKFHKPVTLPDNQFPSVSVKGL
jgi:hypothetical protein